MDMFIFLYYTFLFVFKCKGEKCKIFIFCHFILADFMSTENYLPGIRVFVFFICIVFILLEGSI